MCTNVLYYRMTGKNTVFVILVLTLFARMNTNSLKLIFTDSIAHSAMHPYLSYPQADFEVLRPTGATCCTDWGEIWHGGLLRAKFHPHLCNDKGIGPKN